MTVKAQQPFEANDQSELPDPLQAIVERVVRSARLWPSERRDVRAELESHFFEGMRDMLEDGVALDESIEILHDSFGDPATAAKLIGRSKRKGRPMIWKVTIGILLTLTASTVLAGGLAAYLFMGEPTPTVDYIEQINAQVEQTPEESRAWPILHDALLAFRSRPRSEGNSIPYPGDANWRDAVAWVLSNQNIMPLLEEASTKETYGFIYDNRVSLEFIRQRAILNGEDNAAVDEVPDPLMPPTLSLLLPNLSEMREMARMLIVDSRMHMQNDDFGHAFHSLDIALRLGTLLMSGETIIDQLVGRAIIEMSLGEMLDTVDAYQNSLTEDDLDVIAASHLMTMAPDVIRPRFEGEQLMFRDVVQYVFTDDGKGNGRPIPSQFAKVCSIMGVKGDGDIEFLAKAAVHADRRETLDQYAWLWDRMAELRNLPLYDSRRATTVEVLDAFNKNPEKRGRFALIANVLPDLSRADRMIRETAMTQRAAVVVLDILEFKAKHGELPARLGMLEQKPDATDAYSGLNLRYTVLDDGEFTLYSIGENLIDDGGNAEATDQADEVEVSDQADEVSTADDIVYWPR